MTLVANYWQRLWRRLSGRDREPLALTEVEQIDRLQRTARLLRAEYAERAEQSARLGEASLAQPLSYSRRRMELAEAAHAVALQKWENKQSRQRSY